MARSPMGQLNVEATAAAPQMFVSPFVDAASGAAGDGAPVIEEAACRHSRLLPLAHLLLELPYRAAFNALSGDGKVHLLADTQQLWQRLLDRATHKGMARGLAKLAERFGERHGRGMYLCPPSQGQQ